jgi:hypothetical protein
MQRRVDVSRSLDISFEIILSKGSSRISSKDIFKCFVITLWLEQLRLKHGIG